MNLDELKFLLKKIFKGYVKKHLKRILIALILSLIVALSTSSIAWLLDPAVKKIFIEKDQVFTLYIPILIIIAFTSKGVSLYFARMNIIRVGQEVAGELQKKIGYISDAMQIYVAKQLEVPVSTVHGVVTFYSFFTTTETRQTAKSQAEEFSRCQSQKNRE